MAVEYYRNPETGAFEKVQAPKAMLEIESADYPGCYYRVVDGEVEWFNPPMAYDTEYRTTERDMGKPVYIKAIKCGYLPNTATKNVEMGASSVNVISCEVRVKNTSGINWPMPMSYNEAVSAFYYLTGTTIFLKTTRDYSEYYANAIIKYTK